MIFILKHNIMRKRDKLKNYKQANLMLEQSYLKSKGLLKEEEKPKSITIELTDEFRNHMKEYKESTNGDKGFAIGGKIELWSNRGQYNLVKVGTIPYDIKRDLQFDFWASYRPKANEIYINQSSGGVRDLENTLLKDDSIPSTAGITSKLKPGYYCKFENGFKVGEVDHRGFFKIIEVSTDYTTID